jgi:hypothetical protein
MSISQRAREIKPARNRPPNLVGRIVTMPTPCPRCTSTDAAIGRGSGPHAASLLCVCGNHLGWLPQAASDFILEPDKTFGAATFEPIVLRGALQHAKEVKAMNVSDAFPKKKFDETNRGVLFKNDNKSGDKDPDYSGSINFDGRDCWLSAWIKTAKTGRKFMSLSIKPKDAQPKPVTAEPQGSNARGQRNEFFSDEIPF